MCDPLTRTLLVLTFAAGVVDAVSFLALAQVFATMQTGNAIFPVSIAPPFCASHGVADSEDARD